MASGCSASTGDGVRRSHVGRLRHKAGLGEAVADIVAFSVGVRIDFVGDTVVALIAVEADVVSAGSDPGCLAVELNGAFQMRK